MTTALGFVLGALIVPLYRWLNRQLVQMFSVTIMAITIALVPFYTKLVMAIACLLAGSIASGSWDASISFWMVELWPIGNEAMLQFTEFMYAAGSVVAPLLSAPFVYGDDNDVVSGLLTKQQQQLNNNLTVNDRIHSLNKPYTICAIIQAIGSN